MIVLHKSSPYPAESNYARRVDVLRTYVRVERRNGWFTHMRPTKSSLKRLMRVIELLGITGSVVTGSGYMTYLIPDATDFASGKWDKWLAARTSRPFCELSALEQHKRELEADTMISRFDVASHIHDRYTDIIDFSQLLYGIYTAPYTEAEALKNYADHMETAENIAVHNRNIKSQRLIISDDMAEIKALSAEIVDINNRRRLASKSCIAARHAKTNLALSGFSTASALALTYNR